MVINSPAHQDRFNNPIFLVHWILIKPKKLTLLLSFPEAMRAQMSKVVPPSHSWTCQTEMWTLALKSRLLPTPRVKGLLLLEFTKDDR
jgi:hypothetical protein